MAHGFRTSQSTGSMALSPGQGRALWRGCDGGELSISVQPGSRGTERERARGENGLLPATGHHLLPAVATLPKCHPL